MADINATITQSTSFIFNTSSPVTDIEKNGMTKRIERQKISNEISYTKINF